MKLPVASYTFLSTWAICPQQAYRRFIAKDLPPEEKSPAQTWGIEAHAALEHRVGKDKTPLPEKMATWEPFCAPLDKYAIEPELKLGMTATGKQCSFFADDAFLRGVIDVPIVVKFNAALIDWKTGGSKYEDPYELEVQALLLHARSPYLKEIRGRYVWLKENRLGEEHDCSRTDRTWQRVCATMEDVSRGQFIKTRGPLCGYCPVTDCEHNKRGKR